MKLHDKHAALVSIGRYLGMFDDKVKVEAVYGISEEPMSAEEATFFCVIRHKEISWYINFKQHVLRTFTAFLSLEPPPFRPWIAQTMPHLGQCGAIATGGYMPIDL